MSLQNIFTGVLNMSITAGWMVAVVMLLRLFMRGFPRVFSYALWAVVYFRLLCPFSFTSVASLINLFGAGERVSVPLAAVAEQNGHALASSIDWALSAATVTVPYLFELALAWAIGVSAMLMYGLLSCIKLRKMVKSALPVGDGVYLCDAVDIPFVLGITKPRIYLPMTLKEDEYDYILRHEQIHLLRRDYIIKPIAYIALCLHWFNPLVWLSLRLMTCDMEMSCDEMVIHRMGDGIKRSYSSSLLQMASKKPSQSLHMLAFGETDTKRRIKNVLNYKSPMGKKIVVAVCLVAVVSVTMLTNPAPVYADETQNEPTPTIVVKPSPTPEAALTSPPVQAGEASTTPVPKTDELSEEEAIVPLSGEQGAITIHKPLGDKGYLSAGMYSYQGHMGEDYSARSGTEIYAVQAGTVVYASNENVWPYGKHVIIDHGDGWQTLYAHCSSVLVELDDEVAQDSLIAKVGRTGNANGNHCHMELRYNGKNVNPTDYMVKTE